METRSAELVADPVSHISISGVHGRDELNHRLAQVPKRHVERGTPIREILIGVALGAVAMALLRK